MNDASDIFSIPALRRSLLIRGLNVKVADAFKVATLAEFQRKLDDNVGKIRAFKDREAFMNAFNTDDSSHKQLLGKFYDSVMGDDQTKSEEDEKFTPSEAVPEPEEAREVEMVEPVELVRPEELVLPVTETPSESERTGLGHREAEPSGTQEPTHKRRGRKPRTEVEDPASHEYSGGIDEVARARLEEFFLRAEELLVSSTTANGLRLSALEARVTSLEASRAALSNVMRSMKEMK